MRMHVKESVKNYRAASTPALVAEEFRELGKADQESFWLLAVDTKNKVLLKEMLFLGGVESASVDMKILFRRIVSVGAAGFVVVHNHPSGNQSPSDDDIMLTNKIKEAARIIDVRFLDHVIVGDPDYCSFKERGLL